MKIAYFRQVLVWIYTHTTDNFLFFIKDNHAQFLCGIGILRLVNALRRVPTRSVVYLHRAIIGILWFEFISLINVLKTLDNLFIADTSPCHCEIFEFGMNTARLRTHKCLDKERIFNIFFSSFTSSDLNLVCCIIIWLHYVCSKKENYIGTHL